ncbi:hypothetical protein R3P38DRAFT_2810030 [Favolaschia claudopus]|uniref:Reverse transcriptase zinc-binding domain-containing protein n=1 Tax=Favolaschia claudopus TaxID=2862362 RepID=A0AAV9ZC99_9AGAR
MSFDPDICLTDKSHGFRIFATEDHLSDLTQLPAKRYHIQNSNDTITIRVNARVLNSGRINAQMSAAVSVKSDSSPTVLVDECLHLSFLDIDLEPSFHAALLGGLLYALQNVPHSVAATIVCPATYLGSVFVTNRSTYENNTLDPNFPIIKSIIAHLQERSARTRFKVGKFNGLHDASSSEYLSISLDTQPDLMFSSPGILLNVGSQRLFTKMIVTMKRHSSRKSTISNLDRTRHCVNDEFNFYPSDTTIWRSLRSTDINRLTRNFLWKCMHETFHVGTFWDNVPNLHHLAYCQTCAVPETMEHIVLECEAPGQKRVWTLCERMWKFRFNDWPNLHWGLILGCALPRFRSTRGHRLRGKERFFTIMVSTSVHLIWKVRNERVLERKDVINIEVENRWITVINSALRRDQILTNKARFGSLSKSKQTVLETWSGVLRDEDALPDDWTRTKGVLVGIWPTTQRSGVG